MSEEWITTKEAAELSGYHAERIRELLRDGKIDGQKFGTIWQVNRSSLTTYVNQMDRKGDRRGPKPKKT